MLRQAIKAAAAKGGGDLYWVATLDGANEDLAHTVVAAPTGRIYAAGSAAGAGQGSRECLIASYAPSGGLLWQRMLGTASTEEVLGSAVDAAGNAYICGYSGLRAVAAKYDQNGALQWQRVFDGGVETRLRSVAVDSQGDAYFAGYRGSSGILLIKITSSGTVVFQQFLNGTDFGYGIAIDSLDRLYIIDSSARVVKCDSSGSVLFGKQVTTTGVDRARGIAVDANDDVLVCGYTDYAVPGNYDLMLAKLSGSGNLLWQRTLGGGGREEGLSVTSDYSGSVYVAGWTRSSGAGSGDALLAKYTSSGALSWQRTLGGAGADEARCVSVDTSGSVYACGIDRSLSPSTAGALWVAKLPDDGSLVGAYGALTYAASSLVDAPLPATVGGITVSATPATLAVVTDLVDTASTLNASVIYL